MASFPTTHWTFIRELRGASGSSREQMVSSFLVRYLSPMADYVRFKFRLSAADLDDLMQDFVTDRVIRRSVLDHACEHRGSLRAFLRTCLSNFTKTWLTRQARGRSLSSQAIGLDDWQASGPDDACQFDVVWAQHIIRQGVARLRKECEGQDGALVWAVFEERMYRPMLDGQTPTSYKILSARLGVDPKTLANLLTTAKRKLKNHLMDLIGDYTVGAAEAEEEIRDLFSVLGAGGSSLVAHAG